MRKKTLLRAAMTGLGILSVKWRLLPSGLYCFNFHRIGDAATTDYGRRIFSCTAAEFEDYVVFLKSKFELINLDRASALTRSAGGRKPLALITFDDGYIDNYTTAFDVLRRHNATAVFFLPTAFIGTSALPWWEEIPWMLRQSLGKTIRLASTEQRFHLRADDNDRSILRVTTFLKSRAIPMPEQVEEVREACGGVRPPADGPDARLFINWDEARRMHSAGMDFGSHTHSHSLLAHLSRHHQANELQTSKEILEAELRTQVRAVAYPVGSRTAYSAETCEIANSLGYTLGFNFLRRVNTLPLSKPLDLNRLAVAESVSLWSLRSTICFPRLFTD
jgi:peptidoglycan/xylan/chitin deacetylase (PgdA/CDA1 family)